MFSHQEPRELRSLWSHSFAQLTGILRFGPIKFVSSPGSADVTFESGARLGVSICHERKRDMAKGCFLEIERHVSHFEFQPRSARE